MRTLPILLLPAVLMPAQSWAPLNSGSTASLRGVSAVSAGVVWASGTGGTYLRTTDGGQTWRAAAVPGAGALDFRAVHAADQGAAWLLSIGTGDQSRIYKTADAGLTWQLQLTCPHPKGFFDALTFWDSQHGLVLGDPVDGHFMVLATVDGGAHWQALETPPAMPQEGAFAASGTCLTVRGKREAWFATGGPRGARVFHSADAGRHWTVAATPVRNDTASAGIFSLAFSDARHGIAVGGDYSKPDDARQNIAVTEDGGRTWTEPPGHPQGFRSAVAFLPDRRLWIVTGTSGSDVSFDQGKTWKRFDNAAYNALAFVSSKAGWAVGPKGAIAAFRLP